MYHTRNAKLFNTFDVLWDVVYVRFSISSSCHSGDQVHTDVLFIKINITIISTILILLSSVNQSMLPLLTSEYLSCHFSVCLVHLSFIGLLFSHIYVFLRWTSRLIPAYQQYKWIAAAEFCDSVCRTRMDRTQDQLRTTHIMHSEPVQTYDLMCSTKALGSRNCEVFNASLDSLCISLVMWHLESLHGEHVPFLHIW